MLLLLCASPFALLLRALLIVVAVIAGLAPTTDLSALDEEVEVVVELVLEEKGLKVIPSPFLDEGGLSVLPRLDILLKDKIYTVL